MDPGSSGCTRVDARRWEASLREARALRRLSERARARARTTRHRVRLGRSQRGAEREHALARLQAWSGTMPVIEQAKGIIMARFGWPEDQAFDLLCRASQRANVKVRVLAAP